MEHGQIVFRLFGPAREQVAEPIEPRVRALDDPTPGFLTCLFSPGFFPTGSNVGRVAQLGHYFPHLGVVVARVQAQVLVLAGRPVGVAGGLGGRRQTAQRAFGQLHVVPVSPVEHQPHRDAPRLGQQAALDAAFAAVRGVGPGFFPRPTVPCAANRRGPSRQSLARLSRRSLVKPRPKGAQKGPPAPTPGTDCVRLSPCTSPSHPGLSTGNPCAAQRRWRSAPAGQQCAAGGGPAGGAWARGRAATAQAAPIKCRKW